MAILGKDIEGVEDIDPFLTLADGPRAATQAVMSSLSHNPGVLWWAPERGHSLLNRLHAVPDEEQTIRAVQRQAELDERVESATATVTVLGDTLQLGVDLVLTQTEGATSFTITIDRLGAVLDATITS